MRWGHGFSPQSPGYSSSFPQVIAQIWHGEDQSTGTQKCHHDSAKNLKAQTSKERQETNDKLFMGEDFYG